MGKFFDFLVNWGEQLYECNRESIIKMYHLEEVIKDAEAAKAVAPDIKPSKTASVSKLKTLEAHNS